jgi:hypothetical protein
MRASSWILGLLFIVATCASVSAQVPQMLRVTPRNAKPGDTLSVTGVALDKAKVEELFLTDHKFDLKVKILEQAEGTLKFRIPPFAKPGRMQLLVQTGGKNPRLLEQPVYILVEEDLANKDKPEEKKSDVGLQ